MEPKQEEDQTNNEEIKTTEAEKLSKKAELGYPKQVVYCPKCGLPPEYCEYGPNFALCIPWLRENYPQFVPADTSNIRPKGGEEESKGQAQSSTDEKDSKKAKPKDAPKIVIEMHNRSARKYLTVISGLDKFGLNVKDAAKKFGKKFACGSSVIDDNAIEIQGDVVQELIEYVLKEYKDIKRDSITIKESKKDKDKEKDKDKDKDKDDKGKKGGDKPKK